MKPMPTSLKEFRNEAQELVYLGKEKFDQTPRGKLIKCSYNSWKAGRSYRHVSMMILGLTGSGKSSTSNHLLGVDIAATSEFKSTTRSTTEYVVTAEDSSLDVSDLNLSIIDTPGFNEGSAQDACNLLSIETFCKTSPALDGCYPNIIMILIQSTDTSFSGENNSFYKALKAFSKLGLVDVKNPNVMAVITWANSISRGKWKNFMDSKTVEIQRVILETLKVNAPIVPIENDFEGHELKVTPDGHQTVLPDGTLQPKNLYLAITDVLKKTKDDLGLKAFSKFFSLSLGGKKNLRKGLSVAAKDAKLKNLNAKETEIMNNLERDSKEGVKLPEVDTKISEYIGNNASVLTEDCQSELRQMKTDLVEKLGLLTLADLSKHTVKSIGHLLKKKPTENGMKILKDVFNIGSKQEMAIAFICVGKGYNIVNDEMKPFALFSTDEENLQETGFGIKIPKGMELSTIHESETFMEHFEEEEKYVQNRLTQLGVNASVDWSIFKMKARGGFSRQNKNSQNESLSTMESSFLYEKRLFRIDVKDLAALTLTEGFKNAVQSDRLPCAYDKTDKENRDNYEIFFNNYGHFAIISAYGGGSVEVNCKSIVSKDFESTILDARSELEATFRCLSGGFAKQNQSGESSENLNQLSTSLLKWNGGDTTYHTVSVNETSPESWKKWESSLAINPAILTTRMSLTPIYEVVNLVDPNKTKGCRDALIDLLGGKFTFFLKKEEDAQREREEEEEKKQEEIRRQEETNRGKIAESTETSSSDCFPGNSFVWVKNKEEPVLLQELGIGDEVLCLNNNNMELTYSPVFMFAHKNSSKMTTYLKIYTDSSSCISVSPKHLLQTQKKGKQDPEFTFADHCAAGDSLFTSLKNQDNCFEMVKSKIVQIEEVTLEGLYAPFTLAGTIIVDNIAASCYANVPNVPLFGLTHIQCQTFAHASVGLLRAAYILGFSKLLEIPIGKDMPTCIEMPLEYIKPYLVI